MSIDCFDIDPSNPSSIPKFIDELPIPEVAIPLPLKNDGCIKDKNKYKITMRENCHRFHMFFNETKIWGYNGSYPGPTIEAFKDVKTTVELANDLPSKHFLPFDTSLHGTMDEPEVKTVVHLHGAMVKDDSSLFYPDSPPFPVDVKPSIVPAFFGNTIVVNGKVWPKLTVEPRKYRFRVLNGSNRREYIFALSNNSEFIQIGTDGGFLPHPISINSFKLLPAERTDVIIDFSKFKGENITLLNNAFNSK